MSQEQTQYFCKTCTRATLHARPKCNHILHLLVSLFTCGAWVIVWAFIHADSARGNWMCQTCGASVPYQPGFIDNCISVFSWLATIAMVLILGSLCVMILDQDTAKSMILFVSSVSARIRGWLN